MKKLFLLLAILPVFLFSQNSLVKWYQSNLSPTFLENHILASAITAKGVSMTNEVWGTDDVFYSAGGWPKPNYNNPGNSTLDVKKYVEFNISSASGYKINVSSFEFNARAQGLPSMMEVRYSTTPDFINYSVLQEAKSLSTTYAPFNLKFPANTIVNSGTSLYIRIYVYNTENNFHLQHNLSGTIAPIISGSVSLENPLKPITQDDRTATAKNTPVAIDVLSNDDYKGSGALSAITIVNAPKHGTVQVNGLKEIIYTPNQDVVGADQFYYTLTNAVGVSNKSKVEVQIVDGTEHALVRWNKSDFTATNNKAGVFGAALTKVGVGLALTDNASSTGSYVFSLNGLPTPQEFNGNLDPAKYLQAAITTDASSIAYLKSLQLSYKSQGGTGNMTIKYSKSTAFSGEVFTLANNEPYNAAFINKEFPLPSGVVLYPGETLYIRIYAYNTNNLFFINFVQNAEVGPAFTGVVSTYSAPAPEPQPCESTVTWTGKVWEGGAPDLDKKAVIAGNYNTAINGAFQACTLTVTNNSILTVATETAITIVNSITTDAGSSLIVSNEANLLQINDAAINTGTITVERNANLKRLDYIYWGSPVKGQDLKKFSPGTVDNRFYIYNEANDFFEAIVPKNIPFGYNSTGFESAAKGYAIRASNYYPPATAQADAPIQRFVGTFNGVPNNGVVTFPLQYKTTAGDYVGNGYNLIANPYPSNIDFDLLFADNEDLIDGTAYFWTNINKNAPMQGSGYPQAGFINNYATLNGSGSIAATQGIANGIESKKPSTIIEVGQGFIVKALKAGNLTLKNAYRTSDSDGVFFNRAATENARPVRDRFWLELKTPLDVMTTALVAYIEKATNDFEDRFDAPLLSVGSDALFTKLGNHQLGIQGRQFPLQISDVVAVGMNHYADGEYTLSVGKTEGIFANGQSVYLKDNQTGAIINLTENAYTFTAVKGLSEDRFEIIYQNELTLGTATSVKDDLIVYRDGSDFVVKSLSNKISTLELYDSAARLVYKIQPNSKETILNSEILTNGIYVLKITQDGKVITKKILK